MTSTSTTTIQQNDYIKLISSDGFEFQISKPVAVESPFIKDILSSPGKKKNLLIM
jgi:hypothetical protein